MPEVGERDGLELLIVLQLVAIPPHWRVLRPVHGLLAGEKLLPGPEHLVRVVALLHLLALAGEGRPAVLAADGGYIEAFVEVVEFGDTLLDVAGVVADVVQRGQREVLPLLQSAHNIIIDFIPIRSSCRAARRRAARRCC